MRRVLLILGVLTAVLAALSGPLSGALSVEDATWPLTWLAWAPVGFIILWQRPGNGVGRALMGVGLVWGISAALLVLSHSFDGQAAAWAELVNVLLGVPPWLGIIILVVIFPSGVPETRLERLLLWGTLTFGAVALFGFAVDSQPMEETGLTSPLAIPALSDVASAITGDESFLIVVVLVLAATTSAVLRWRRSDGVTRAQYRWLLLGATFFAVVLVSGEFFPEEDGPQWLFLVGISAIPAVIGFAVLRYRLFEIDRIVSRTISYLLVVGLLAAVFFGTVTAVSSLLETQSDLAIAASTLAVAALFNPVRKRIQNVVDRRFNRSRYDAQKVMDSFAGSLQDEVDSEEVVEGWVGVVSETMQPVSVGVWMRET